MSETATVEPGETGLLDNVQVSDEAKTENPQNTEINHKAADPSVAVAKDSLERPDYWPENFWKKDSNEPDMEGIAKSWSDLRKQISQGKHKAPEGGKYDTSVFKTQDVDNDPLAKTYVGWAQKYGISQVAFDELAQNVNQMADEMAGPTIDTQAEMKSLGPNANAVVNGMVDWARGLVNKGVWSSDDFAEFKIMGGTARGLTALMKVRSAYEGRVPIEVAPMEGAPSKEELYQMVGDPKYKTDTAFRQKVERLFNQHMS